MTTSKVYIKSAAQVSAQLPLSDDWATAPAILPPAGERAPAQEPAVKELLTPMQSRRMGRLLKRSLAVCVKALRDANLTVPNAIITGTGMGCLESTGKVLVAFASDGEDMMQPTHFMQSTHNTIGSAVATHLKCHGYNATYSHDAISGASALLDAHMQLTLGDIDSALVLASDELPEVWLPVARTMAGDTPFALAEGSVAMVLDSKEQGALCELAWVDITHGEALDDALGRMLAATDSASPGLVLADRCRDTLRRRFPNAAFGSARRVFGHSPATGALALYAATWCVKHGKAAPALLPKGDTPKKISSVLVVDGDNENNSVILIKSPH